MASFVQNRVGRAALLAAWNAYARIRFWGTGPRVFVNSIPKAGTHLLTTVLEDNSPLFNARRHLQMHRLNRLARGGEREYDVEFDADEFARETRRVRAGQFFTAHIFHDEALHRVLRDQAIRTVFMIRDPRDILVSAMHYARDLRRHPRHALHAQSGTGDPFELELCGRREAPFVRPLKYRLQRYAGWLDAPGVLTIRFEDLVGAPGGMSDVVRDETLAKLSDHLGVSVRPKQASAASATFRKGRAFGWKDELTPAQVRRVAEECGEELEAFGYPA